MVSFIGNATALRNPVFYRVFLFLLHLGFNIQYTAQLLCHLLTIIEAIRIAWIKVFNLIDHANDAALVSWATNKITACGAYNRTPSC
jgi:hypothetical protein